MSIIVRIFSIICEIDTITIETIITESQVKSILRWVYLTRFINFSPVKQMLHQIIRSQLCSLCLLFPKHLFELPFNPLIYYAVIHLLYLLNVAWLRRQPFYHHPLYCLLYTQCFLITAISSFSKLICHILILYTFWVEFFNLEKRFFSNSYVLRRAKTLKVVPNLTFSLLRFIEYFAHSV